MGTDNLNLGCGPERDVLCVQQLAPPQAARGHVGIFNLRTIKDHDPGEEPTGPAADLPSALLQTTAAALMLCLRQRLRGQSRTTRPTKQNNGLSEELQ